MNRLVALLAIGLFVAACGVGGAPTASSAVPPASVVAASAGAGSSSSAVGSTVEACDLLTEADILELTELEVDEAVPGPAMGVFENGCEWSLTGETATSPTSITLGVLVPGGRRLWEVSFEPFGDEPGTETIEGLGDGAHVGEVDDVIAVQGDALVSLQFLAGFGTSDDLPVELTRRVLLNLAAG